MLFQHLKSLTLILIRLQKYILTAVIYTKRKKGRKALYMSWPSDVWLNEWSEPDAKLIVHRSYKERSCSIQELMKLDVNDVIAYLKQEGLNLIALS